MTEKYELKSQTLPEDSSGFSVYRFVKDDFRAYTSMGSNKDDPLPALKCIFNRCQVFSGFSENKEDAKGIIDILNEDGDCVESYYLTEKGLRYFIKTFKLRVEKL